MEKKEVKKKIRTKMKWICLFVVISSSLVSWGQQRKTLLMNGFLHVGNGETIPTAAIGMEGDKIVLVKNSLTYSAKKSDWDTIIDLKGQHVYPGFIAPNSTLGLTEVDAIRATRDFDEVGTFNPHVRSMIAFNVESTVISTVKTNGVLFSQVTPRGGLISGSSSVMHLDGWNWEDALVKADDGIHLNWPSSVQTYQKGKLNPQKHEKYDERKKEILGFFELAKSYSGKGEKDIRLEAMKDLFSGTKRLYIHANEIQQLLDIIEFKQQFGINFPVIVGGYDSYLILDRLKDAKIPIMLPRTHSLPELESDAVDLPYKLPSILQQAGILFCLQNEGDMEAMNARNIPFLAGTAQAYGLTEEQAVASISLNAAKIMGMEKQIGSVEEGKKATLFVSKGNALDVLTNDVTLIFVNGKQVSNKNRQTELYEKYKNKKAAP